DGTIFTNRAILFGMNDDIDRQI
ncbi:MAG: hypothetical protein AWT59_0999, partial [Candidatus Gallionella acididurans]